MSLLRFGFITLFLSDALVSGYTAAAAFTIFITQLAAIFGLNSEQAALPADLHFFTTPQVGAHSTMIKWKCVWLVGLGA